MVASLYLLGGAFYSCFGEKVLSVELKIFSAV